MAWVLTSFEDQCSAWKVEVKRALKATNQVSGQKVVLGTNNEKVVYKQNSKVIIPFGLSLTIVEYIGAITFRLVCRTKRNGNVGFE